MKMEPQEVNEALGRGFYGVWHVLDTYELASLAGPGPEGTHRVLFPNGTIAKVYAPILHPELPSLFAKLHPGDEQAVINFARVYGHLTPGAVVHGDPLPWIWAHAATVRLCVQITHHLQADTVEGLDQYLRSLRGQWLDDREYWPCTQVAKQGDITTAGWPQPRYHTMQKREHAIRHIARLIRRDVINWNIAGIHFVVQEIDGKDRSVFSCQSLIDMVYWHVANAINGQSVRRCANQRCGALFIQTRQGQQYCPARWRQNGRQKDSPCASGSRVQKHRSKPAHQ